MSSVNNRIVSGEMSGATSDAIKSLIERVRQQVEAQISSVESVSSQVELKTYRVERGDLWVRSSEG
jgi:hypothetical protein